MPTRTPRPAAKPGRKPTLLRPTGAPPAGDALEFLRRVMNDPTAPVTMRVKAAQTLARHQAGPPAEPTKAATEKRRAGEVVTGRFTTTAPPRGAK